jgi:hypothetical protein
MRNLLKSEKTTLLTLAIAFSFFPFGVPISGENLEHVYCLGFPGVFFTLYGAVSQFPAGLGINPLQFLGNVGVNWLILSLLIKAFRKLAFRLGYKKGGVD